MNLQLGDNAETRKLLQAGLAHDALRAAMKGRNFARLWQLVPNPVPRPAHLVGLIN